MAVSGGIDWVVIQRALQRWVVSCTGLPADKVVWAQQYAPRPTQDAIIMRFMMIDDTGRPWIDHETNPLIFNAFAVTSVDDVANTFTKASHGLLTGDGPVNLTGASLPGNISSTTPYWVIRIDDNTFKLALSFQDAVATIPVPVDISSAGSGTITVSANTGTLRAGQEIVLKARSVVKAILTLEAYSSSGVGLNMPSAILWRINAKRLLPTALAILEDANIGVIEVGTVKAIDGMQDLALFEPRALVDIMLQLSSEDSDTTTIIEVTEITNNNIPDTFTVDGAG